MLWLSRNIVISVYSPQGLQRRMRHAVSTVPFHPPAHSRTRRGRFRSFTLTRGGGLCGVQGNSYKHEDVDCVVCVPSGPPNAL